MRHARAVATNLGIDTQGWVGNAPHFSNTRWARLLSRACPAIVSPQAARPCPQPVFLAPLPALRLVTPIKQGTFKVSWEKVGKSLVGLLALVAVAATFYRALRDDERLQARLTYAHLT